jgi:hypothetical protein
VLALPNRLLSVLPTESKLLLLCLGFVVLACVLVEFVFCLALYFVLSVFLWWVLWCLTNLCCLSLDFFVFILCLSLFTVSY